MSSKFIIVIFIFLITGITGCNRDEIITAPPAANTSKGAYVLSEGGFNPGTSKLSFYNRTKDSFYVSIFNPGNLGLSPDGMILNNNNLYITEQGNFGAAGKIFKTDTNGTVITSADAGINPYSLAIANNKIYITNGPANNVTVLDKNSFSIITTIGTGVYPQEIISIGNKVFVCNTSVFNGATDSTVTVIDATSDQVVSTIKVRKSPSALAVTTDGKLLVGCPGNVSGAAIFKIDPNTYNKLDSFTNLGYGFCKDISVISSDKICYIAGNIYAEGGIVTYNMSSRFSALTIDQPSTGLNYSLAYDSEAGYIYVGYVPNFTVSGKLIVYNTAGVQQNEFTITNAIAPRRIVIKK